MKLARVPLGLSRARRYAAIAPIVFAVFAWFVVPSFAASSQAADASKPGITVQQQGPDTTTTAGTVNPSRVPVTGADAGVLRTLIIGSCLLCSGLIVVTGVKRNPHEVALLTFDQER